MMLLFAVLVLCGGVAGWIEWRYPLRPLHPRFRFNALLPRLLGTGAVTLLGWCFVRGHTITAHHRAHETYHHLEAVRLGRWRHVWRYLRTLSVLAWRTKLSRVEAPSGRVYFAAYYDHPEERAARQFADRSARVYVPLGVPHA